MSPTFASCLKPKPFLYLNSYFLHSKFYQLNLQNRYKNNLDPTIFRFKLVLCHQCIFSGLLQIVTLPGATTIVPL